MSIIENKIYLQALDRIARNLSVKEGSILVTGATGLIGSCMVDALLYANRCCDCHFKVYVLGRSREKMQKRFSYIQDEDQLVYIEQDICAPFGEAYDLDYIIHGASNADPRAYSLYPAETLLTNIYGTKNMLEYCKDHKSTRLLLTSTFEVYGRMEGVEEYREDMSGVINMNQIRSCYPESKRCAEILMRCYGEEYQVDWVIARLCSIYGPTMSASDSKAHAQFIRNALNGQDIVLKSEGLQRRTYCYVMDAADALFKVLFEGVSKEAYNISNEESVATIAQVAQTAAKISGRKVTFELPDEVEKRGFSAPQNCVLNNEKLRALGWKGKYTLEEGLSQTIAIMKELQ